MPKYIRACLTCQKEFTSVYLNRCFCCSAKCGYKQMSITRSVALSERYWPKVAKNGENGCWKWVGSKDTNGYGRISTAKGNDSAHRVSYELHYGPIPDGKLIMHSCDNPECTNPAHLSLGTGKDNAQDMVRKGRGNKAYGVRQAQAKLTDDIVITIRKLGKTRMNHYKIAAMYGVARPTIDAITNGKTWKHLLLPK